MEARDNTMKLRLMLIAVYGLAAVLSFSFGMLEALERGGGWLTAFAVAAVALSWIVWGEPAWLEPKVEPVLPPKEVMPVVTSAVDPQPFRWEEQYVSQATDAILRIGDQLTVQYANAAAERLLGYASGEMNRVSLMTLFPEAGGPGKPVWQGRMKEKARRGNGGTVLIEMAVTRVTLGGDGSKESTVVLCLREAVEGHRMAAMEEKSQQFEDYFRWTPVPLVVFNREGHVERMNHAAEEATEYAAAELRAQPYWNVLLPEADREEASQQWRNVFDNREAPLLRQIWQTRAGGSLEYNWQRVILKDDFGQPTGLLAAACAPGADSNVDVTALTDQLTAVNGYSELLLMSMPEQDPNRADLESIHRAGMAASLNLRREAA